MRAVIVLESMLAPSLLTSGPTSSPPIWAVSSAAEQRTCRPNGEVKIGIWIRFVS